MLFINHVVLQHNEQVLAPQGQDQIEFVLLFGELELRHSHRLCSLELLDGLKVG